MLFLEGLTFLFFWLTERKPDGFGSRFWYWAAGKMRAFIRAQAGVASYEIRQKHHRVFTA